MALTFLPYGKSAGVDSIINPGFRPSGSSAGGIEFSRVNSLGQLRRGVFILRALLSPIRSLMLLLLQLLRLPPVSYLKLPSALNTTYYRLLVNLLYQIYSSSTL